MRRLNRLFNYIIVFIILGYGAVYFFSDVLTKPKPSGKLELSSNDIDQVVNKYLKQTTENMQKEKISTDRAIYQASKQPLILSTTHSKETDPSDVPVAKQIWRDSDMQTSPGDVINNDVYNDLANDKLDEAERQQYAKDFVENARRGGFHVILTDDLSRIKSVTPIRQPSQHDDSVESNPSN